MSDTMTHRAPATWPTTLAPYWIDDAELLASDDRSDERAGRDSLGNVGRVHSRSESGSLGVKWTRSRIVRHLEETGLATLRDVQGESEMHRAAQQFTSVDIDPFLLERSVRVIVKGRDFPGQQRAVLEAKVEKLRRELSDPTTASDRKEAARAMLDAMHDGLKSTVDLLAVERRFRPEIRVDRAVDSMGSVIEIERGMRIVYDVRSSDPNEVLDDEAEPMVFHVVGLGVNEVVVLFTGGVHGLRHITDLNDSSEHAAWFANRERSRTTATAPWISRRTYRELVEDGETRLLLHPRRDPEPVPIKKIGEATVRLPVAGVSREVPVILCESDRDDELTVLADPECPLVLRLHEKGSELLRTVEAILAPIAE